MKKDSPVVVMVLAVIAVCGTLGGVWLGRYLERDNDALKWRREHALEAYLQLLQAVDVLRFDADRIYVGECLTEEHLKQATVILDRMADIDKIAHRIVLLAPESVNEKLMALTDHAGNQLATKSFKCPKIEKSERTTLMTELAERIVAFRTEARNDLGIHPPRHTVEEWNKIVTAEKPWWRFWR